MGSKTVLYISYDGMTDNLGQSQVIPYLSGLSKHGYDITILSFEKKLNYAENKGKIAKLLYDNAITWNPISYTAKPPVLSTVWDIWKMYKAAQKVCISKNVQIVHCRSYISALIGLQLNKSLGTKFIFDMRGFWADERVEGKIWNLKNPAFKVIYKYFKRQEIKFLNKSDYSISLTEAGKRHIMSRQEIRNDIKVKVIPCCADLNHFNYQNISEETKIDVRKQFGYTSDQDIFTYLGSIGTWYMLDEMLTLYAEIHSSNSNARFLFLTADKASDIIEKAESKGIPNDYIKVYRAQRAELPGMLSISKASVFFIIPTFSKTASSPTKMGELMGMGIPLICNSNVGDVSLIMKDTNTGIIVPDFSKETLHSIALRCNELEAIPKESIRLGALKWYSLEEGILKYKEVYEEVLRIC